MTSLLIENLKVCLQNPSWLCMKISTVFTPALWLNSLPFVFVYFLRRDYFWNKKEKQVTGCLRWSVLKCQESSSQARTLGQVWPGGQWLSPDTEDHVFFTTGMLFISGCFLHIWCSQCIYIEQETMNTNWHNSKRMPATLVSNWPKVNGHFIVIKCTGNKTRHTKYSEVKRVPTTKTPRDETPIFCCSFWPLFISNFHHKPIFVSQIWKGGNFSQKGLCLLSTLQGWKSSSKSKPLETKLNELCQHFVPFSKRFS